MVGGSVELNGGRDLPSSSFAICVNNGRVLSGVGKPLRVPEIQWGVVSGGVQRPHKPPGVLGSVQCPQKLREVLGKRVQVKTNNSKVVAYQLLGGGRNLPPCVFIRGLRSGVFSAGYPSLRFTFPGSSMFWQTISPEECPSVRLEWSMVIVSSSGSNLTLWTFG